MTALIVIGAILLLLVLLAFLRVGVRALYGPDGPVIKLRLGPLRLSLYPQDPAKQKKKQAKQARKAKKPKKAKKAKQTPPAGETKGGGLSGFLALLPIIRDTLGRFRRKLRIDRLIVRLTVAGGDDPAAAAINFGRASAVMGLIIPVLENTFDLRKRELSTDVDFTAEHMQIYAEAELTLAVWHLFYIGGGFLFPFLRLRKGQTAAAQSPAAKQPKQDRTKTERSVSK